MAGDGAGGLSLGGLHRGEAASGDTSQDLLLLVPLLRPVLLYGGGVGHRVGFTAAGGQGDTWGMDSEGFGLTSRGAGQANWLCGLLPDQVRGGGGGRVLQEEVLEDATVPDT